MSLLEKPRTGAAESDSRGGDRPVTGSATSGQLKERGRQPKPRYGFDAVSVLTVYLFLLCALPSGLTVTALGSIGHPATLWALFATLWWLWGQLQRHTIERRPLQPVRLAYFGLVAVALISYAWAMIRGIPSTEVITATSGLITIASWGGIVLIALDGVTDLRRFEILLRRVALTGALIALLGLLQFATGKLLTQWMIFPGMTLSSPELAGPADRAGFLRASGTAMHPLEYGVVLCVALPLAIAFALRDSSRPLIRRWTPVVLLSAAIALSVSRSALIGAVVAFAVLLPGLTRRARWTIIIVGIIMFGAVIVAVPGMFGTVRGLFTGLSSNPSAISRTNGLSLVAGFVSHHLVIGKSFGTFLPTYYIFDDAYLLMATELGLAGVAALLALIVSAVVSAARARRLLVDLPQDRLLGQALIASVLSGAVLFAFFDGLSFPQAAGMLFLCFGLSGALWRIAIQRKEPGQHTI